MKTHIYSFAALAFLIFTSTASATTYYVDGPNPAASDSNPGTEALPLKTIQKGIDLAVAGDRVFVKAGVYAENLVIKNSGVEGNPIVIDGQKGQNGERLVTVNAGIQATNWQPAPEIGAGVYKNNFSFTPEAVTIDGKNLDRVNEVFSATWPNMVNDSWKPYFTSSAGVDVNLDTPCDGNPECSRQIKLWDLTYGIFGNKNDGNTYIRLKDGSNPNNYNMRASDAGQAITFRGHSYITFKGFRLKSFSTGFRTMGEKTHHIIIEDNYVSASGYSFLLNENSHDIIVRNNEITYDHHGFIQLGAWDPESSVWVYEDDLRSAFYRWQHHGVFSVGAMAYGFSIGGGAKDIEISENVIYGGYIGLALQSVERVKISRNEISGFSSVGIFIQRGVMDLEIFENTLYNSNINVRFQDMELQSPRRVFIYKNFFGQRELVGTGIYFHWNIGQPIPNQRPTGYIYHNNFSGGIHSISTNYYGPDYYLLPDFFILNNILSSKNKMYVQGGNPATRKGHLLGSFNYNWVGRGYLNNPPSWFGVNNIQSDSNYFWLPPGGDNFSISADSNVIDRGLDLSVAQDVNGRVIGPLPGITSSYYCGSLPDIGAVQYCPVVTGCGDGVCVAGETPASCAADCNSGAVNCGTKGKFCAQNEYCSSGVCIKNGCPAPPIDFAKLKTYEGSWLNKIISMAEFMAKILEWKKCGARI